MSGERPAPLWPVALQKDLKLRPVENQRIEALPKGVSAPVAKQLELSKTGEQSVQQPSGTSSEVKVVYSGEPVSPRAQSEGKPGNQAAPKEAGGKTLDPEVEEAIRAYAMGDREEEAQLREQVKNDPDLRHAFLHPGGGLAYGPHPPKKD
jgi:hypothetical protein